MISIEKELFHAIEKNDEETVRKCIESGTNLTAYTEGITHLILAIHKKNQNIIKMLLDAGADPNQFNLDQTMFPANQADNETIRLLMKYNVNLNEECPRMQWPVYYRFFHQMEASEMVDLIRYGVDLDNRCNSGMNFLHIAAYRNQMEKMKILIENGINIDQKDNDGKTPLLYAIEKQSIEAAHYLLDRGADPRLKDKHGRNAFMNAAMIGNKSLLERIVTKVIASERDLFGKTAFDHAKMNKHLPLFIEVADKYYELFTEKERIDRWRLKAELR